MRIRKLLACAALGLVATFAVAGPAWAQEEEHSEDISHAAEECIHTLEDGGEPEDCHESPSPILPATNELIWGTISFLVLLFLLKKFAWPGLKQGLEARSEKIRQSIDEADAAKVEADTVLAEYRAQLADAKGESARIIEEARQSAEALRREQEQRLQVELADMRARAAADVESAKQQAIADLRGQVAELAIGAAETVVRRSLGDRETQIQLIEDYINSVGAAENGR